MYSPYLYKILETAHLILLIVENLPKVEKNRQITSRVKQPAGSSPQSAVYFWEHSDGVQNTHLYVIPRIKIPVFMQFSMYNIYLP